MEKIRIIGAKAKDETVKWENIECACLFAVYRRNLLKEEISSAIDRGQRKSRDVWQQVKAVRVQFANETAFFNINNLTDIDRWRKAENEKANLC